MKTTRTSNKVRTPGLQQGEAELLVGGGGGASVQDAALGWLLLLTKALVDLRIRQL